MRSFLDMDVGGGVKPQHSDRRFGINNHTLAQDNERIFKVNNETFIGLTGLGTDVLTLCVPNFILP